MLARINTSAVIGVKAIPIDVEIEVRGGAPKFTIIGLGDGAIRESKDRITAAIRSSGFKMPGGPVLVSLTPAELKKEGSSFDIAMALGILAASKQIEPEVMIGISVHGELSLDGTIKGVRGLLSMVLAAKAGGRRVVIVPAVNAAEASLVSGIKVVGVASLQELCAYLRGEFVPPDFEFSSEIQNKEILNIDDVYGQEIAKRALYISAAGGHNTLLIGPPGCGKSMLAKAFRSILPPLSQAELLEVATIHSSC